MYSLFSFSYVCSRITAVHPHLIQLEQHRQWWMCWADVDPCNLVSLSGLIPSETAGQGFSSSAQSTTGASLICTHTLTLKCISVPAYAQVLCRPCVTSSQWTFSVLAVPQLLLTQVSKIFCHRWGEILIVFTEAVLFNVCISSLAAVKSKVEEVLQRGWWYRSV